MPAWLLWMLALCVTDERLPRCSGLTVHPISAPTLSKVSCPALKAPSEKFSYLLLLNNSYVVKIRLTNRSEGNLFSGHFEVKASSGVYVCRLETIYPPPFTEVSLSTEVKAEAAEARAEDVNGTAASAWRSCPDRLIPEEVLWAACGLLLLYSLCVSGVVAARWRKQREEACAVYMNTRHADPRKQGKP